MKLRILSPPSWSISISLTKWARKLKISLAGPQPLERAIVLGNGVPDCVVLLILGHKFNGEHLVAITKPQQEIGTNPISTALELIKREKVRDLMIVLDQEIELESRWGQIEDMFKKRGVEKTFREKGKRFRIYTCSHGDHKFKTLFVLNGLNKPYPKHTIEDHLLESFKEFFRVDIESILDNSHRDPKWAWRKLEGKHQDVYCYLLEEKVDKVKQIFPQHIQALNHFLSFKA